MQLPRFYPILDTALLERSGLDLAAATAALLQGGARILQFRHKAFFSRAIFEQAERVATMCREAGALFVMNDRADFAAMLNCALHVGQEDLAPSDARRVITAGAILGLSTHNEAQFRAANDEPVDYLAIGPMFDTTSKANSDPVVGLKELSRIRPLTRKPVVAIGGITRENAAAVFAAGADSAAVIGDLFSGVTDYAEIRQRTAAWMRV